VACNVQSFGATLRAKTSRRAEEEAIPICKAGGRLTASGFTGVTCEGVCKPPLMTTTSHAAVVEVVTAAVSKLTDLLQNDHWTDGGRPVYGDKSVPDHGVLYNSGLTESLFSVLRRVFYFRFVYLHFRFNLAL